MKLETLAKMLNYGSVQSMLDIVGMQHRNMNNVKYNNPARYAKEINNIILVHYDVKDPSELIQALETIKKLKNTITINR